MKNNFTRGSEDKLTSLSVGKIVLIKKWLDEQKIQKYTINPDLTIDIDGSVVLFDRGFLKFPDYIQFNKVTGSFFCNKNNLISLRGCPKHIVGSFNCGSNNLKNLIGGPAYVGDSYYCDTCHITSFEGIAEWIGIDFTCRYNDLKSFDSLKTTIGGDMFFGNNNTLAADVLLFKKRKIVRGEIYGSYDRIVNESIDNSFTRGGDNKLTSLGVGKMDLIKKWLESYQIKDYTINDNFVIDVRNNIDFRGDRNLGEFPSYIQFGEVHGSFDCSGCNLKSLRGCPIYVEYEFDCANNDLKSLQYGPIYVGDDYVCRHNKIMTAEGFPLTLVGHMYSLGNPAFDELYELSKKGKGR